VLLQPVGCWQRLLLLLVGLQRPATSPVRARVDSLSPSRQASHACIPPGTTHRCGGAGRAAAWCCARC
jgi:hypothetical protein